MHRIPISDLANSSRFHQQIGAEAPTDWEYIEISRVDLLYMRAHGIGDDERFAHLFNATWQEIPAVYRKEMIEWWENEHPDRHNLDSPAYMRPHIELRNDWPADCGSGIDAPGVCRTGGLHLLFRPEVIDDMPCEMVKLIIAHELAHVWQSAVAPAAYNADSNERAICSCIEKWPNYFSEVITNPNQREFAEYSAHSIAMKCWGRRAECPFHWLSKHVLGHDECKYCNEMPPCPIEFLS